VNANALLGTPAAAAALAQAAGRRDLPAAARVAALEALADWGRVAGRDPVVGVWRVRPERDPGAGLRAMEERWEAALGAPEPEVAARALRAWAASKSAASVETVRKLALGRGVPAAVRVEALRALVSTRRSGVQDFLEDPEELVRMEAVRSLGAAPVADRPRTLERFVAEDRSVRVRQAALEVLGGLEGRGADEAILRLLAADLPAALRFDLEEAAAKRPSPSVKEKLAALPKDDSARLLEGGDPARGEAVYQRPDASCVRCHRIRNGGGTVGPDLTLVGSRLGREKLLESLLDPNREIAQGYEQVLVRTKSGEILTGRREREDERELVLLDAEGRLLPVAKASIEERKAGKSAMPEDLAKKLSPRDLRDLVAYLAARAGRDPKTIPLERGAVVVDDEDEKGFRTEGNWRREPLGGDYGRSAHWAFPDRTGRAKAIWTATLPRTGSWRVYAWTGIDPVGAYAPNAPFTVEYAGGSRTVRVDLTKETCSWRLLGTFPFDAAIPARVVLSTDADARVNADAVKFVPE
jgi:quinoprotein glucose dehydrogenase